MLGELRLVACAAPRSLAQHGSPAHPRELEDAQRRIVAYLSSHPGKVLPYAMRVKLVPLFDGWQCDPRPAS